jgi:glycine cleavage system H protein
MAEPQDRLYAKTHEWVKIDGDEATVGITLFAQEQLGDVVFVELSAVGSRVAAGDAVGNIESVKAVSELFCPVAGEIVAVNDELEAHPELVNQDPYGSGWLLRLRVGANAGEGLMDAVAYGQLAAAEGGH